jgi:hypothetical protein
MLLDMIEARSEDGRGNQAFIDCIIGVEVDGHLIHTQDMRCVTDLRFVPTQPVLFTHDVTFRFKDNQGRSLSMTVRIKP